jgi:hypothetical protein
VGIEVVVAVEVIVAVEVAPGVAARTLALAVVDTRA